MDAPGRHARIDIVGNNNNGDRALVVPESLLQRPADGDRSTRRNLAPGRHPIAITFTRVSKTFFFTQNYRMESYNIYTEH
jgi:hypothetical protein